MKRSNVNVGTRAEILAELDEYGADRAKQGNAVKAAEYARAIRQIELGSDMVRVRSMVWIVLGEDSPQSGEIVDAAIQARMAIAG